MNKTVSEKFARFISTLFVPPSFTILIFSYFAFKFEHTAIKQVIEIATAFIFGFSLHIALFLYLRKKGRLVDLDASIKEERTSPFLIAVIFYAVGLGLLLLNHINNISIAFWFCYISNTLIIVLVNKYWKISIHAMGSSGPAAALFIVLGPAALLFLILTFVVCWSRVKLKCHTVPQVIAGAALGLVSSYLQILLIVSWLSNVR